MNTEAHPESYPADEKLDALIASLPHDDEDWNHDVPSDKAHMEWMKLYAEKLPDSIMPESTVLHPIGQQYTLNLTDVEDYDTGKFTAQLINDETEETVIEGAGFEALKEIYDFRRDKRHENDKIDVNLTEHASEHIKQTILGHSFAFPEQPTTFYVLEGANPTIFESYRIRSDYGNFLKLTQAWLKNPNSIYLSWAFLNSHPIFWMHDKDGFTDLSKDGFKVALWHEIAQRENGEPYHMFEAGQTVHGDYTHHYHDFKLDVYSDTYEEGIIEMAHRVHKFFNWDGSERNGVEYTKSQVESDLEEAIENFTNEGGPPSGYYM